MKLTCMLALCLFVVGCSEHRDLTEYRLDEDSFDAEAMAKIEEEAGIDLPDAARGLRFHHIPPIDPIVFAKIELPDDAYDSLASQIDALSIYDVSQEFANDRCDWWQMAPADAMLSKRAFNNGYYVDLYLVKEKEHLVLYIKYFTL